MPLSDVEALAVANWRKASSSIGNGACVEVASAGTRVLVRDTVDRSGPAVAYAPKAWQSFVNAAKQGSMDSLR